jgi:hypothetical protein
MPDCNHIYDEYDLCFECNAPRPTQSDNDRTYRAKQATKGIVRKTIQVPLDRWPELQEIAKKMRDEARQPKPPR